MNTVNQLGQTYRRERCWLIAEGCHNALDQLLDSFTATLGRNDNTGVQDQSHAGGSSGSRWLSTAASRSLEKPSSRVAVEARSRARRSDSESKRTDGSAA